MHPAYIVFAAASARPTKAERASCAYLWGDAEAKYLQQFFDPLYESDGIGISTSDDEIISGAALYTLAQAVAEAKRQTIRQPETWSVTVGYRLEPTRNIGPPIVRKALKFRTLEFLEAVAAHVKKAQADGGCVHFGGGH